MSDGPHRSPNMRRHWKKPTEYAGNFAHTLDDVCAAMKSAVAKDILEAPISKVREIMNADMLFQTIRTAELEALRGDYPGSAATSCLIDSAIVAVAAGDIGDKGTEIALQSAIEENARANMRAVDEICQREASAKTSRTIRERLEGARTLLDAGAMAREILAPPRPPSRRSLSIPKQTGIDVGPPL